jgi:serine/threonine protein kinase
MMPPPVSADNLAALLKELDLLAAEQQEAVRATLAPAAADARALAQELVQRDWLTPYQANQLLLGNGAGLAIGSYRLLQRLGEGGMGQVFRAKDVRSGRTVALKILQKDKLATANARARFMREARSIAALRHPNIVGVFAVEEIDGQPVMALEFVEGMDLRRLVKQRGALPIAEACEYARQAALGLQAAHEKAIVHRDIKPSNLVIANGDGGAAVKVLDFGFARFEHEGGGAKLTQLGTIVGTVDYISPEQAEDASAADIRSDIYSLGCTLFYALTGQAPFAGGSMVEKITARLEARVKPIRNLRPDLPASLEAAVARAMARDPAHRYQTPIEFAAALAPFAAGQRTEDRGQRTENREQKTENRGQKTQVAAPLSPAFAFRQQRGKQKPWMLVAGALGAVAVIGGIVAFALSGGDKPGDSSPGQAARPTAPPTSAGPASTRASLPATQPNLKPSEAPTQPIPVPTVPATQPLPPTKPVVVLPTKPVPPTPRALRSMDLKVVSKEPNPPPILHLAIDPTGRHLAALEPRRILLWNLETGSQRERALARDITGSPCFEFTADGETLIYTSNEGRLELLDPYSLGLKPNTGQISVGGGFRAGAIAPDRLTFAVHHRNTQVISVRSATTRDELMQIDTGKHDVRQLAFSPQGQSILTAGLDGSAPVRQWSVADKKQTRSWSGPKDVMLTEVLLSPGGRFAAFVSMQRLAPLLPPREVVRVHSLVQDRELQVILLPSKSKRLQLLDHGGKPWLASLHDSGLLLWDALPPVHVVRLPLEPKPAISAAAFTDDGAFFAVAANGEVLIRELKPALAKLAPAIVITPETKPEVKPGTTITLLRKFEASKGPVHDIAMSRDGKNVLTGHGEPDPTTKTPIDCVVRWWDVETAKVLETFSGHTHQVMKVALSPRVKGAISLGLDMQVFNHFLDTGKSRSLTTRVIGLQGGLHFIHDGASFLVANPKPVLLQTGIGMTYPNSTFEGAEMVTALAVSPDSKFVAAGSQRRDPTSKANSFTDFDVYVWESGKPANPMARLQGNTRTIRAIAFTPDSKRLLTLSDDSMLRLWDIASGKIVKERKLPRGGMCLALSRDGRTGLIGAFGEAAFFDPVTLEDKAVFRQHGAKFCTGVAFAADGKRACSCGADGSICIYSLP